MQLPLPAPVLHSDLDEGMLSMFDALNDFHDEILLGTLEPLASQSTPPASEEPKDMLEDTGTEDLDLVVDGIEGLSTIEICEVKPFSSVDPMVLSGVHPVLFFN